MIGTKKLSIRETMGSTRTIALIRTAYKVKPISFPRQPCQSLAGLGVYDVDAALTIGFPPPFDVSTRSNFRIEHEAGYLYSNIDGPDGVTWTLGLSYDDFEQADLKLKKINPKAGVQWDITEGLRLRLAAFRTIKPALVANRTIQPTEHLRLRSVFRSTPTGPKPGVTALVSMPALWTI